MDRHGARSRSSRLCCSCSSKQKKLTLPRPYADPLLLQANQKCGSVADRVQIMLPRGLALVLLHSAKSEK